MKKIFLLCIVSISLFAGKYNIDESIFTNNNWAKPAHRTLKTSTNYDYNSQIYYNNHGFWHGAVDIITNLNENVYSIADGKVVAIYRKTTSTNNLSVIYIQYKTEDNIDFLVIYGHTYAKDGLKINDTVKKNEFIGNVKRYGSPDHIHFGITTNLNYHSESFGSSSSWTGVVNPLEFLSKHKNKNYSVSSTLSIVDGAGSLVSSTENIAGGNHDYALMHPHSSSKSTVVFQWLYDVDSCSHIDLFAYPNALDVTVQAKRWDGHLVKEMFNVTLNAYNKNNLNSSDKDLSNGISLEKVDNSCSNDSNCDWTTLAVTSQKPLKSNEYIIAHCRDNSSAIKRGNRQDITPELVSLDNNYFWTGTGSLISKLEDRNFESAGVGKDYAATYNTKKSFTTFQWYTSDNCRKVKIQGYKESSSVVNEVAFKEWNASSWTSSKCDNSLPCTIVAPKIGNYFIIKVKSNAGAIGTEYLQAECVE